MTSPDHSHEHPEGRDHTPDGSGSSRWSPGRLRGLLERRSAVFLVWLHQLPGWVTPLALGVLFIAGLMAPGPLGALCLLVVAVFLTWLAFLTWPSLSRQQKTPRLLMVVVVLVLATARILGF